VTEENVGPLSIKHTLSYAPLGQCRQRILNGRLVESRPA